MTNKQIRPCVIQRRIALVQPIQNTKSAASGSLPRRRFSVADQSEHFTAKPPLKKKVFVQYLFGGAEGSRTPVRKRFDRTFSGRRTVSAFPPCTGTGQTVQFSRVMMHGRGNSYPPHVRHINDAFPGLWPLRFRRLPLVRQRQQYDCCQLIFKLPVLRRSGAAARLSCLHTPVETGTAPYEMEDVRAGDRPGYLRKLICGRDPAASPAPDTQRPGCPR